MIKRLEQAKQAAHNDFKKLHEINSDMKFDKQRSQSKCDHHYAPNISSGFNVDNFYNICLKYFSKIKLYYCYLAESQGHNLF